MRTVVFCFTGECRPLLEFEKENAVMAAGKREEGLAYQG